MFKLWKTGGNNNKQKGIDFVLIVLGSVWSRSRRFDCGHDREQNKEAHVKQNLIETDKNTQNENAENIQKTRTQGERKHDNVKHRCKIGAEKFSTPEEEAVGHTKSDESLERPHHYNDRE